MRFARSLSMALLVSITGCATVTDSMKALKDAVTPSSSSSSTNASATKPAAAAPQNDTPVPLAVQRAFDHHRE